MAYELSNPAAAAVRATSVLRDRITGMRHKLALIADGRLDRTRLRSLVELREAVAKQPASGRRHGGDRDDRPVGPPSPRPRRQVWLTHRWVGDCARVRHAGMVRHVAGGHRTTAAAGDHPQWCLCPPRRRRSPCAYVNGAMADRQVWQMPQGSGVTVPRARPFQDLTGRPRTRRSEETRPAAPAGLAPVRSIPPGRRSG